MRIRIAVLLLLVAWLLPARGAEPLEASASGKVYVLPIKEDIMPPLAYLVRRGVKEAIEAKADLLVLDMETNGGRVDTTEEIISILGRFKGRTVTYVNQKAFSAGAFIAVATQEIFMAPQSVIGAAAPIMMSPGGGGVAEMPATVEAKMTSAIRSLVRANAEKNGYNVAVVEAMIDKSRALEIDGETLNEKGQILTLTDVQAARRYGNPPKALLSSGTVATLDDLIKQLGFAQARRVNIVPTGAERLAFWINAISPLLLVIGAIGIYVEFKTPGFGLPGIVGITAFAIYFLGSYVAALSGMEWVALFAIGLILVGLELFVFPGTAVLGLAGFGLMLGSVIMAMVDVYPQAPGVPLSVRVVVPYDEIATTLALAAAGTIGAMVALRRLLPSTALYGAMVTHGAVGEVSVARREESKRRHLGAVGETISVLRPGGKARFGEELLDVIAQGDLIRAGEKVRIIGYSGADAIVERNV